MPTFEHGILGQETHYEFQYNPALLFPIPRAQGRFTLGIVDQLPFVGVDRWTAYEVSWLDNNGMPQVRIADVEFSADSVCMVESKSFKLYLNSFNQTIFANEEAVIAAMQHDLTAVVQSAVSVVFKSLGVAVVGESTAICLDDLSVVCQHYFPQPELLQYGVNETEAFLCTHLFRSLCPVTGQPDWASVYIRYAGCEIVKSSLLQYLVSYRQYQGFHEQCIEQIYCDIWQQCKPNKLMVYGRFLRRGGLDINPLRSSHVIDLPILRVERQ